MKTVSPLVFANTVSMTPVRLLITFFAASIGAWLHFLAYMITIKVGIDNNL